MEFRFKYAFSIDQRLALASNPYSWPKVQNSRQTEQLFGGWGPVKLTSVVEALLIRKDHFKEEKGSFTKTLMVSVKFRFQYVKFRSQSLARPGVGFIDVVVRCTLRGFILE